MQKQIIDYFKNINISQSEAELYFTLLESGPLNARSLAQKLGFKRTTAYNYIDHLLDRGLILKLVRGTRTLLAANEPDKILPKLIDQKVQTDKQMQESLPQILESIQGIFPIKNTDSSPVEIKYYKGIVNARKIYEECFTASEVRAYAKIDKTETLWSDNTKIFNEAFEKNKKLKFWEIIYGESAIDVSENIALNTDRYFFKFMPKELKLSSEDILLYDGKVAIINFRGGGTSIVLQSADFYNNLKELFDFMWNMLSETKKSS